MSANYRPGKFPGDTTGPVWTDDSMRQGRDDPRPVEYHLNGWFCVGVALCAFSAIIVLLILTYMAMHFPRLWA